MWPGRIAQYLLPGDAEDDEGFRTEIVRLSRIGLSVIGAVQITLAIFMTVGRLVLGPDPQTVPTRLLQAAFTVLLGLVSIALSRTRGLERHLRAFAIVSGAAVAGVLIWHTMLISVLDPVENGYIPGEITLVMLVGVTAVPLRPTDTMVLGCLCEFVYVALALLGQRCCGYVFGVDSVHVLFIIMLTLLATGLTAIVYEQRRSIYGAHQETLRAAEQLRAAEARNLLAQNAVTVGRLAAALSHELNSPIGALVSGVDTLLLLAGRQATAAPAEQPRLVRLQADLRKSIHESANRLKEIVARMQRFTNLDRAEVQVANINEILSDVAALLEPEVHTNVNVELKLEPVPPLLCRPQQLSAVFSNLITNAINAVDGAKGHIEISTRAEPNGNVRVEIADNGRGLSREELERIFDPSFKAQRGRMSATNWSMFSSRQIVLEHGGEILIESRPGEGTRVQVVLPRDTTIA